MKATQLSSMLRPEQIKLIPAMLGNGTILRKLIKVLVVKNILLKLGHLSLHMLMGLLLMETSDSQLLTATKVLGIKPSVWKTCAEHQQIVQEDELPMKIALKKIIVSRMYALL